MELIKANINDPQWHHSDEENAADLIVRANKFLLDIDKRHEVNILAVSHGRIIQAIIEVILQGKVLTPEIYQSLKEKLYLSNSGATIIEKTNDSWHLLTWNDNSHLENI